MTRKLPVGDVIAGAFALPWARREAFARALAVPAIAIVAIEMGWWLASDRIGDAVGWAAWAAKGAAWMLLAIACHRLVLLDRPVRELAWFPGWGLRETRFLVWLVVVVAMSLAITWVAALVVGTIVGNISKEAFEAILPFMTWILMTYVFARFALVFPATAIDERTNPAHAWRQTRGNGWRMFVVVGGLPLIFGYATRFAAGDEPGIATALVLTIIATALLAVEVAALSLSYRALTLATRAP